MKNLRNSAICAAIFLSFGSLAMAAEKPTVSPQGQTSVKGIELKAKSSTNLGLMSRRDARGSLGATPQKSAKLGWVASNVADAKNVLDKDTIKSQ